MPQTLYFGTIFNLASSKRGDFQRRLELRIATELAVDIWNNERRKNPNFALMDLAAVLGSDGVRFSNSRIDAIWPNSFRYPMSINRVASCLTRQTRF